MVGEGKVGVTEAIEEEGGFLGWEGSSCSGKRKEGLS